MIDAHIIEVNDGPYYQVKFASIPKVGELIKLFSYIDQETKHEPNHFYEVVQILHDVQDISENRESSISDNHFVKVFVKKSNSSYFKD